MVTVHHASAYEAEQVLWWAERSLRTRATPREVERPAFASDEHERFYDSEAPEIVASAWMGAGKSRVLCQKAWDLARKHRGSTLGLFRKVAASLPATTERTFWRDVADPAQIKSRNKTEGWAELHNGSRIYFMGLDPDPVTGVPSKVGSLDLDWAGVDEAVEVTEADWIMLGGRLRRTAMPYRQLAAATNPASPSHWLKRRFTPPTETHEWVNIVSNRFLPPDYHERLADMGSGFQAQRLAKGLWVAAEGAIWLLPDSQIAELDPHLSGLPMPLRFHRRVAGIDWGYQHAFACEVVAETGTGRKGVVAELYARGRTVPSLIPELVKLKDEWQIETFYADPSEPAYIAECRAAGLPIVEATNDVLPGLTAVADEIVKGLLVSPRCAGLLSEIPGYVWQIERGSGMPKDVPQKVNDDACDALRYAVMALRGTVSGKWSLVA